jgi:hypothetical protein
LRTIFLFTRGPGSGSAIQLQVLGCRESVEEWRAPFGGLRKPQQVLKKASLVKRPNPSRFVTSVGYQLLGDRTSIQVGSVQAGWPDSLSGDLLKERGKFWLKLFAPGPLMMDFTSSARLGPLVLSVKIFGGVDRHPPCQD